MTEEARKGYQTRWNEIQDQMLHDLKLRQVGSATAEKTFDIVLHSHKEKKFNHGTDKENISFNQHDSGCHASSDDALDSLSGGELEFENEIMNITAE